MLLRNIYKIIVCFVSIFIFYLEVNCQNCDPNDKILEKKAEKLMTFYNKSFLNNVDSANCYKKKFFSEFPSSFSMLVSLYGFCESSDTFKLNLLYDVSRDHIDLFGSLDTTILIKKTVYLSKLFSISINGFWQSDGINYFQNLLHSKVEHNIKLSIKIIESFTLNDQKEFWHFFFDGPILPGSKKQILEDIKEISEETYKIAHIEVMNLQKQWKH